MRLKKGKEKYHLHLQYTPQESALVPIIHMLKTLQISDANVVS